jgi:hypothetical protein
MMQLGGTNDTGKNESSKCLLHTFSFVKNRGHTNSVMMNTTHRHDLDTMFCIDSAVKVFGRKLLKKMKMYDYAKVIETRLT